MAHVSCRASSHPAGCTWATTTAHCTSSSALAYLSLGIDPTTSILFRQSDVPEITELFWILGSFVPISHLERAHGRKMSKSARNTIELFATDAEVQRQVMGIRTDPAEVGRVLADGAHRAREIAAPIMAQVRLATGVR